ncbi:MAG TPA: acyl-CoA thioesterase [Anaeromyxobacteraceae bacterium]|nr:acyl-CoA thioesterase [Anaeromyxobacteraceae bacterium]
MPTPLEAKPPSTSAHEMTHLVMPYDANALGTAFGGMVVQWTDLAAGIVAMRHSRLPCVTASIDQLSFLAPIRVGELAILRSQVNAVFGTSMEIGVEVLSENPLTGDRKTCCHAFLTFVALDGAGRPTRVPPLRAETQDERRREAEARARREARLAARSR